MAEGNPRRTLFSPRHSSPVGGSCGVPEGAHRHRRGRPLARRVAPRAEPQTTRAPGRRNLREQDEPAPNAQQRRVFGGDPRTSGSPRSLRRAPRDFPSSDLSAASAVPRAPSRSALLASRPGAVPDGPLPRGSEEPCVDPRSDAPQQVFGLPVRVVRFVPMSPSARLVLRCHRWLRGATSVTSGPCGARPRARRLDESRGHHAGRTSTSGPCSIGESVVAHPVARTWTTRFFHGFRRFQGSPTPAASRPLERWTSPSGRAEPLTRRDTSAGAVCPGAGVSPKRPTPKRCTSKSASTDSRGSRDGLFSVVQPVVRMSPGPYA